MNHAPGLQTGPPSQYESRRRNMKKKSPSYLKRNARRLENFLEEKRKFSPPASSSPHQPPPRSLQSSEDISKLSFISETPMIIERSDSSEAMDAEHSDQSTGQHTLEQSIPVISARKESIVKDSTHISNSTMNSEAPQDTITNSQIQAPWPRRSKPLPKVKSSPIIPDYEEVIFNFCAKNQATALQLVKTIPKSCFLEPHPRNESHHFRFLANLGTSNLKKLKTDISHLVKLPKDVHLLSYRIASEDLHYHPPEKKHCPECR